LDLRRGDLSLEHVEDRILGVEADEELAALAKAIGHPARVQILRILARRDACICGDIVDELPLAQSTVSQHLKVLQEVGLIRGTVDGSRVGYCIEPRALRRFKALVGGRELFASDAIAMIHEAAMGGMRDADRLATSALREAARKKRKLVERDAVARVIDAHTNGDTGA
jgi:ArsR family transcriptional regulator